MKSSTKYPALFFFLLLIIPVHGLIHAQSVYDAGVFTAGKIRVTKEIVGFNSASGEYHQIGFRMFTVDSVNQPKMLMGNHYNRLRAVMKQDDEASIYLVNATHWERSQRICLGVTAVGLATVLIIPMDQKTFNIGMGVNAAAAGGILLTYIFKRHWSNKAIKTWNRHLDERKFVYHP